MIILCTTKLASDTVFTTTVMLFQRGGVVMWPLLACSLLAVAQAAERILYYARVRAAEALYAKNIEAIFAALTIGHVDEAESLAARTPSAAGRIILSGLRQRDVALRDALNAAAECEIAALRRGLTVLDTIITLAPLLGILGTVTGIIRSFHMLSASGAQDPSAVTGGIAEALITTAAGLIISIMSLIPFNAAVAIVRRRTRDFEQLTHRVAVCFERGRANGT